MVGTCKRTIGIFVASMFLVTLLSFSMLVTAVEPDELLARIDTLIAQLDSDSFTTRDQAQKELRVIGQPCLAALLRASDDQSAEVAKRLRVLIPQIRRDFFQKAIVEFASRKDAALDVEEGMWLISCIGTPHANRAELSQQLDRLAEKVRKHIGDLDPKTAEPKIVVDAILDVLFDDNEGFYGNVADYQNPKNSSLYYVLKRRSGLPILLSHVVVSVAERLNVPIVGVGIPGRYMALYPAMNAPPGTAAQNIIIDAFSGQVLSAEAVKKLIPSFDPAIHLVPAENREILVRMLNNMIAHYHGKGDLQNEQRAMKFRKLLVKHAENPARFSN